MADLPSLLGPGILEDMAGVASATPPGAFVEVGVYKGGSGASLAKVAERQGREIYLYDTFAGLPYKAEVDTMRAGEFSDTSFEAVAAAIPYAKVVKGIFPQSAVLMPKIAFVHLDVDQYWAYRDAIAFLSPMMVPGGVMWFDDYGCLPGATLAVDEAFPGRLQTAACGKSFVMFWRGQK
jgi:O-methyltransferase